MLAHMGKTIPTFTWSPQMSGPDGPEQRTAYAEDAARDRDDSEDARLDYDADLQRDDDLLDIAQARMLSWALDRVLR